MYTNTKVMFSKIASGMTIFMMIFSMVGPMNARAQEATLEEIPAVVSVLGCMDSSATNYNVDATEDDDSCEYEKQEESSLRVPLSVIDEGPDLAQISAYKIICPSEDLLPNWGDGAANITASTAGDFINENPECEIVDWTFEWADEDTENPGDNVNEGGSEWTSFASAVMVPAGEKIWVREQMQDGYIPFSGNTEPAEDDEDGAVSAEFYCSNDVLHYDNYDFINPLNADTTYHCVAFNVLIPVLGCTDKNALNYNPDATEGNENAENCEYPDPEEGGICEEGDEEYTSIYTSDEDTMLGENPAEILTFIHDAWTATISDASWIWSTDPVELAAETDEVETFTKTFQVTGTPTSASLMIAADNFYSVDLNGEFLCADAGEVNFSLAGQDTCVIDVSDLDNGTNTLEFTVTNKHLEGETANSNPAGLMYKLEINGDCEACEMQEGWAVDYFNYEPTDVGMNLPTNQWYVKSAYGNPLSADNTFVASADAWTGWSYANPDFSQVENDLMFGASNFFPFDSGAGLPFKNESTVTPGTNNGKDFHFGLHAKGFVTAPSTDDYGFTLTSDDDVWIYVNGELIVDNSGVHGVPGPSVIATIPLNEGVNEVDLYYAERHFVQAALNFEFTDDLVVMTTEDCLPPPPELCMNDGANNYGQPLPCTYDPEPTMCDPEINLIQNGGFESPEVASGGWGLFPQGDLMGWILEWIYDSEGTPTLEIQNNVAGAPDEGNQHAELDGNHPVGMYQVIETVPGETYDFSYAYSARDRKSVV